MLNMEPTAVIGGIGTAIGFIVAGYERFRSNRSAEKESVAKVEAAASKQIQDSFNQLITIEKSVSDAHKLRFENEHSEFVAYRNEMHAKHNEFNAKILILTEENIKLQAKTDLSAIYEFQKDQRKVNDSIVTTLNALQLALAETMTHIKNSK